MGKGHDSVPYAGAKKLMEALDNTSFDVVKVNSMGRKQKRVLRLTSDGIQNIKGKDVVTKQFSYKAVQGVRLTSTTQLVISYNSDHDFVYRSPEAVSIVREISNRLYLHRCAAFEKTSVDYQIKSGSVGNEQEEDLEALAREGGLGAVLAALEDRRLSNNTLRLFRATGHTPEERVKDLVSSWVYNKHQPEGNTIGRFLRKFNTRTGASSVRGFLDGMFNHILDKRKPELAVPSRLFKDEGAFKDVVESVLQEAIVVPLFAQIQTQLRTESVVLKEGRLHMRCLSLRSVHQLGFEIREKMLSPSNWAVAVRKLQTIEKAQVPCAMLQALLGTARVIYALNKAENPPQAGKSSLVGADDFLPVFIFVVVQACLAKPLFLVEFLWLLSPPGSLSGEAGYYLTVFQSAVEHVRRLDVDRVLLDDENIRKTRRGTHVGPPKLSLERPHYDLWVRKDTSRLKVPTLGSRVRASSADKPFLQKLSSIWAGARPAALEDDEGGSGKEHMPAPRRRAARGKAPRSKVGEPAQHNEHVGVPCGVPHPHASAQAEEERSSPPSLRPDAVVRCKSLPIMFFVDLLEDVAPHPLLAGNEDLEAPVIPPFVPSDSIPTLRAADSQAQLGVVRGKDLLPSRPKSYAGLDPVLD